MGILNGGKIVGITRIRNESAIIQDTLDYYSKYLDGIYIYDDLSTDNTLEICKAHPSVLGIVEGKEWNPDRTEAEYQTRQAVLERAQKDFPDWIVYFDADERIEFESLRADWMTFDGVIMKLFDFYITSQDVHLPFLTRKFLGPEYRNILMMFKNTPELLYHVRDQREVSVGPSAKLLMSGYVKHYGKAISVEEWEKTCDYYMQNFPEPYKTKWAKRKGKAVHRESDFGFPLIEWHEKKDYEVRLTPEIEQFSIFK